MSGQELAAVGRIVTVHGIRGELVVEPYTDFPERLGPGREILLETPGGEVSPRRILARREHKGRYLILLEGVPDRTAAEALRGGWLRVPEGDLPALPPGTYYRHELVGLEAVTEEGRRLGQVREILETGGENLVLVVHGPAGEVLIPFIELVVRRVNLDAGEITVHLLEGLAPES